MDAMRELGGAQRGLAPESSRARALLRMVELCWGMSCAPLLQAVAGMVDYAMVSQLGDAALAGVGLGLTTFMVIEAVLTGLSVGVQSEVATALGTGRSLEAAARAGNWIAMALSLPCAVGLYLLSDLLLGVQAPTREVAAHASEFFRARCIGLPFLGFVLVARGLWFGRGAPGVYVRILLAAQVLNVALNWLLIYGNLGFPALGVAGAGWGTTLAYGGAALACAVLRPSLLGIRPPWSDVGRAVLRVALPAASAALLGLAGMGPALLAILKPLGDGALAAGSVLVQVALITSIPPLGAAFAATTLVAEALGRESVADAREWMRRIAAFTIATMTAAGLLLCAGASQLISGFVSDPEALDRGRLVLQILGLALGPQSVGIVFLHGLLPTTYAIRAAAASVGLVWLVALPVAAWGVRADVLGLVGAFLIVLAAFCAQTLILGAWWFAGAWRSPGAAA